MKLSTPNLSPALLVATVLLLGGCNKPILENLAEASSLLPSAQASSLQTSTTSTAAATPQAPDLDMVVVPGTRLGPVTATTTHRDLVTWFGTEKIKDDKITPAAGVSIPITTVNLGADKSFTVIWSNDSRSQVTSVRNIGTAWKLAEGIGVGSSFETLQAKLGDFWVYGLGWNHGGTIELDGSRLSQYKDVLVLRIQVEAGAEERSPSDYGAVSGAGLYISDDPHYQALNPTVGEMIVYLTPPTE